MHDIKLILIACFGAFTQEFLHLYDLRKQITTSAQRKKYDKMLRSLDYWLLSAGFTLVGGVFTWLWYHGDVGLRSRDYLVMGIAFPLIVKKVISAFSQETKVKLGEKVKLEEGAEFSFSDYFRPISRWGRGE
jgi:hypothetical protein